MSIKHKILSRLINHKVDPFIDLSKTRDESEWHHELILHLASVLRPKVYVELGLRRCPLFNRMTPYADRLIGVDLDPQAGNFLHKNKKTEFVCSTTLDFAKTMAKSGLEIDMLFIDADHSNDAVYSDFVAYFPYVKDDGIIILHDSFPKDKDWTAAHLCGDGYKAIYKLSLDSASYEMMTLPFHPGLTLCRKRTKQLSWL